MKKITKINPSYTVDIDQIEYLDDIEPTFALGKHNAGLALTDEELMTLVDFLANNRKIMVFVYSCRPEVKKDPWYKRLWNWIRRK